MPEDIHIEQHEISPLRLQRIVEQKFSEYYSKTYRSPHYIKIPEWVYIVARSMSFLIFDSTSKKETMFGLIPCPTSAIEDPNDIEIF